MIIYISCEGGEPINCSDLDIDKCDQYTYSQNDGKKQCLPVGENGKCELKYCKELSYSDCNKYSPIGEGEDIQNCIGKNSYEQNEPECELKKCSEMTNCYDFISNNEDYKCIYQYDEKTGMSSCAYLSCKDLKPGSCSNIYYEDGEHYCLEKEDQSGCEKKKCTELESTRCNIIPTNGKGLCLENEQGTGCELKNCNQLKPDQCQLFGSNEGTAQCMATDDGLGCEFKECYDMRPPYCHLFYPRFGNFRCMEYNGKCAEKQCSDFQPPNCKDFKSLSDYDICDVNPEDSTSCSLRQKKCDEYSYISCNQYNYNSNEEKGECVQKQDKSGCELRSCSKMDITKCGEFIPINKNEKCVPNSGNTKCEIQKCSEQISCDSFIPNDLSLKCLQGEGQCELKAKECNELSVDQCNLYDIEDTHEDGNEDEENPKNCVPNENNDGCELKLCSDLNKNECNKYKPIYEDELQCISRGNGCQLAKCTDLSSTECASMFTDNLEYKCVPDGGRCKEEEKQCSEMPAGICRGGHRMKNGDECIFNAEKNKCMINNIPQPEENANIDDSTKTGDSNGDSNKIDDSKKNSSNISNKLKLSIEGLVLFFLAI